MRPLSDIPDRELEAMANEAWAAYGGRRDADEDVKDRWRRLDREQRSRCSDSTPAREAAS